MHIVIVGAGHAGGTCAAQLRQNGFDGDITLIGAEPSPPYQRPPLSKAWLKGEVEADALLLRPESFYADQRVTLRTGTEVTGLNRITKTLTLADGSSLGYDKLVLAAGVETRRLSLPGGDEPSLLSLRTAADADRVRAAMVPGRHLILIGAGYVGLEVAASARQLGVEVTIIERQTRVLSRVASETLSRFFHDLHRRQGAVILTNVEAKAITHQGRRVELADGRVLEGDAILVGIGSKPNKILAEQAGLPVADGIIVDETARTLDEDVYAIGDCTNRPAFPYGVRLRLESVPNALEQAKQAAAAITGTKAPAPEVPWFWSDQFDRKLQIAGLPLDASHQIVRGDPASGSFSVVHVRGQQVRCVEAVNAPADFMGGRLLIAGGQLVDLNRLADPDVPMKAVLAA